VAGDFRLRICDVEIGSSEIISSPCTSAPLQSGQDNDGRMPLTDHCFSLFAHARYDQET